MWTSGRLPEVKNNRKTQITSVERARGRARRWSLKRGFEYNDVTGNNFFGILEVWSFRRGVRAWRLDWLKWVPENIVLGVALIIIMDYCMQSRGTCGNTSRAGGLSSGCVGSLWFACALKEHCPTEIAKFRLVYFHVISPNNTQYTT